MRFKLIAGKHVEGGVVYHATRGPRVIETDRDLAKLFKNKFERLDAPTRERPARDSSHLNFDGRADEEIVTDTPDAGADPDTRDADATDADLDGRTNDELREIAETEGIDLSGATRKADVLRAIRRGRGR